jgi:ribosome modulation factor
MDRETEANLRWAYVEGRFAFAEGKSISQCPYRNSADTEDLYDRWVTGWRLSFAEYMNFRKS